jgi:hypothetical protein
VRASPTTSALDVERGNGHLADARSPAHPVALLEHAHALLDQASTLDDVIQVASAAEAVRSYARQAQLGLELMNAAAETRIRAERKAGALLLALRDAPRSVSQQAQRSKDVARRHAPPGKEWRAKLPANTLRNLGVDPMRSSAWQAIAQLPEHHFET